MLPQNLGHLAPEPLVVEQMWPAVLDRQASRYRVGLGGHDADAGAAGQIRLTTSARTAPRSRMVSSDQMASW